MNQNQIPQHIAIIMDGNGRWAKKRNLPRTAGHKQGAENIKRIAIHANNLGVKALTLYAFSTENWKRPESEVDYLCKLPAYFFKLFMADLMKNNIRVEYLGEIERFPEDTQKVMLAAVEQTSKNTGLRLCLAINYGSQREILLAAKKYAKDIQNGKATYELDEEGFSKYLFTKELPDVDLMIRTSGEVRLSNFLLWQVAYAEMMFIETAWPDFTNEILDECIETFQKRNRRFGGL